MTGRATPVLVMGGAGAGGGATGAGGGGDERGVEWERPMVLDRAADGEDGRDKQTGKHGNCMRNELWMDGKMVGWGIGGECED